MNWPVPSACPAGCCRKGVLEKDVANLLNRVWVRTVELERFLGVGFVGNLKARFDLRGGTGCIVVGGGFEGLAIYGQGRDGDDVFRGRLPVAVFEPVPSSSRKSLVQTKPRGHGLLACEGERQRSREVEDGEQAQPRWTERVHEALNRAICSSTATAHR